jgi:hypothetical protein
MDGVISYASPATEARRNVTLGVVAMCLAGASASWVVWRSLDLSQMLMFFYGSRMGGYRDELYFMPAFWLIPAIAISFARRARLGITVCRSALWASIAGWVVAIVMAMLGPWGL